MHSHWMSSKLSKRKWMDVSFISFHWKRITLVTRHVTRWISCFEKKICEWINEAFVPQQFIFSFLGWLRRFLLLLNKARKRNKKKSAEKKRLVYMRFMLYFIYFYRSINLLFRILLKPFKGGKPKMPFCLLLFSPPEFVCRGFCHIFLIYLAASVRWKERREERLKIWKAPAPLP